jgi:hypothetical protein
MKLLMKPSNQDVSPLQAYEMSPDLDVMLVTPEMAEEWLGVNENNRNISKVHVDLIVADMEQGNFMFTGDAIKFAWDGKLLDGQHRLHAIVKSGIAQQMLVVRGLPRAAQEVMDTGRKRTASDALKLRGGNNTAVTAAAARFLLNYPREARACRNVTTSQILAWVDSHPGLVESVRFAGANKSPRGWAPESIIAAAHYLTAPVYRESFESFIVSVVRGANLAIKSPELAYARWNNNVAASRAQTRAEEHYIALARAFNAKLIGRELGHIKLGNKGSSTLPLIGAIKEVPTW